MTFSDEYTIISQHDAGQVIKFKNSKTIYTMIGNNCFIDEDNKIVFNIEKSFDLSAEDVQEAVFMEWKLQKKFPSFHIVLVYCLSNNFIEDNIAEFEYLQFLKITVFNIEDSELNAKLASFISKYKS